MLIVIEGPDGAGKTTLIEALRKNSERYFLITRSAGYPKDDSTAQRYVYAMGRLKEVMEPSHVVCDRYIPISEHIYRPICRGGKFPFFARDLLRVDRLVYCRPSLEKIEYNVGRTQQMQGVVERTREIVSAYDQFFLELNQQHHPWLPYDYTQHSVEDLAKVLGI